MKKYLSKYNRNFIGLTGRPEALTKFARNFSLVLVTALGPENETERLHAGHSKSGGSPIDHSSHLSVVDRKAN